LNTCNITNATPRKQIRDFSAGVNDLGLWNSMVCWPLRSSQNYGSGTTAFSLGGLGTYNGTLVNGPTFEAAGLQLDGTNDYMNTNLTPSATDNVSVFVVSRRTSGAFGDVITQLQQFLYIFATTPVASIPCMTRPLGPVLSKCCRFLMGKAQHCWFSFRWFRHWLRLVSPFWSAQETLHTYFSQAQLFARVSVDMSALNTLYKDTLGTGLGLP
jgi:hypothetical protein